MVLTPDVDAPVASTISSSTVLGDMSTEMHCYDSCIDKNEVDTDLSSHVIERPLLVSVVKQMAILGFNAILLIADTRKRFSDMQTSGICQKLLIAQSSSVSSSASGSGLVEAADGEPINHISDSTSTPPHGNSLDTYRNVVSSILTSMTIDALNGVPNSKTSDTDTDLEEVSLSHPISVIEGAVDPLNYTIENGKFHILRAEKSPSHDIDYSEDIQSSSSSSNSNSSNSNSSSSNNSSTEEETDDEVEEEEVDVNGQEKVRSRRRRLRVFSIRLWS